MTQNRNNFIEVFIGNISNAIVHEILEKSIKQDFLVDKYRKELLNSLEIAKRYRDKINPTNKELPNKDIIYIRGKIINRVKSELLTRINKGYQNIDLSLIETLVNKTLINTKIKQS